MMSSISAVILLEDDFPGSSLDTGKWTEMNQDAASNVAVSSSFGRINTGPSFAHTGGGFFSVKNFTVGPTYTITMEDWGWSWLSASTKVGQSGAFFMNTICYDAADCRDTAHYGTPVGNTTFVAIGNSCAMTVESVGIFADAGSTAWHCTWQQLVNRDTTARLTSQIDNFDIIIVYNTTSGIINVSIDGTQRANGTVDATRLAGLGEEFKMEFHLSHYPYNSNTHQNRYGKITIEDDSVGCNVNTISTDTTLVADQVDQCYNITTDDVVFDCDGFNLNGSQEDTVYLFDVNADNVTIQNCNMHEFPNVALFNPGSDNSLYYNNTAIDAMKSSTEGGFLRVVCYNETVNNTMILSSFENYTSNDTSFAADTPIENQDLGYIKIENANETNIISSNFNKIFASLIITSEGFPTRVSQSTSIILKTTANNLNITNSTFLGDGRAGSSSLVFAYEGAFDKLDNLIINFSTITNASFNPAASIAEIHDNVFSSTQDSSEDSTLLFILKAGAYDIHDNILSRNGTSPQFSVVQRAMGFASAISFLGTDVHDNVFFLGNVSPAITGSIVSNLLIRNNLFKDGFTATSNNGLLLSTSTTSTNWTIDNNTFINSNNTGVRGAAINMGGDFAVITNNNFSGVPLGSAITLSISDNSIITNNTITGVVEAEGDIRNFAAQNLTLLNNSFNKSNFNFDINSVLYRTSIQFYMQVNVTNESLEGIDNAEVNIKNRSSDIVATENTSASGLTSLIPITEYKQNGDSLYTDPCTDTSFIICDTPHTIEANKPNFTTNSTSLNFSFSQTVHVILPVAPAECWTYNAGSKFLSIPVSCLFETSTLFTV